MLPSKSTPARIRFAHVLGFSSFLSHVGTPVGPYFRRHGLPTLCHDPDMWVPLSKVWTFFDDVARREDPMLGWLVGAHVGDHQLNAGLLQKLETASSLLQALHNLAHLVRLEASDRTIGVHERRDDILFYTNCSGLTEAPGYKIAQAYSLSVFIDLIRNFLGTDWHPSVIGLEVAHASPILEELFPGSQILAQQKTSYIAIPRFCLSRVAPSGRAQLEGTTDVPASTNLDYAGILRELLKPYLAEGYLSEHFASDLMDTSVRTLTRRLSTSGLTYGTLIDDLRFQVAKNQLRNPGMQIVDIAQSVGFQDQGNFTRMFRRIGGLTPRKFRETLRD